jgi:hypothetical protein
MSSSFTTKQFSLASADYKDLEGFIEEMDIALRRLDIYVVQDPRYSDSDMYGVIFHKGPVNPYQLYRQLKKEDPDSFDYDYAEVKKDLTPNQLWDLTCHCKVDRKGMEGVWEIVSAKYSPTHGWLYILNPVGKRLAKTLWTGRIEVDEKYLSLV